MQVACGTDIIEIKRIQESIEELGNTFIDKIYTPREIQYCESKKGMKYQHYAARFAAKEAIFKAVSNFLVDKFEISWKKAEVIDNKQGKPQINFIDIEFKEIISIDLSLSHCKEYATATVVILYE